MDTGTHLNDPVETASSVALRQKASDEGDVLATFGHANFGNTGRLAREILAKLGWLRGDDGLSPARRLDNVLRRLKKAGKVQYLGQKIGWVEVPVPVMPPAPAADGRVGSESRLRQVVAGLATVEESGELWELANEICAAGPSPEDEKDRVAESYASCCSRQRVMRSGAPMRRSTSIKP